jgi:hypothetical protein
MSRDSRKSKAPAKLAESVHQQLNLYAMSATAAGVGMLALAHPAEAKIVYTPAHQTITSGGTLQIDLNHDGIMDFGVVNFYSSTIHGTGSISHVAAYLNAFGSQKGNQVRAKGTTLFFASALPAGRNVGHGRRFAGKAGMESCSAEAGNLHSSGAWRNVRSRFLGLKFLIKGKTHYGWARLDVSRSRCSITATLTGYAYETVPNKPIVTGQKQGSARIGSVEPVNSTAHPMPAREPVMLGLLASGAPGLSAWRRENSAGSIQ